MIRPDPTVMGKLRDLPALHQAHDCDLKVDTGVIRVWVTRTPVPDEEGVSVEFLKEGRWVTLSDDDAGVVLGVVLPMESGFPTFPRDCSVDVYVRLPREHIDRPLREIAVEIRQDWGARINPNAELYLDAIGSLEKVTDTCGRANGKTLVRYFLLSATGWRGETARRIKDELREMTK